MYPLFHSGHLHRRRSHTENEHNQKPNHYTIAFPNLFTCILLNQRKMSIDRKYIQIKKLVSDLSAM